MKYIDTHTLLEEKDTIVDPELYPVRCRIYLESNIRFIREDVNAKGKISGCIISYNDNFSIFVPDNFYELIDEISKKYDNIEAVIKIAEKN